jgi:hypothetical protein
VSTTPSGPAAVATPTGLAVVVTARPPEDALAAALLSRALAWARDTAPGADYVALAAPGEAMAASPGEAAAAPSGEPTVAASELPPPDRRLTSAGDPDGAGAMDAAAHVFAAGHAPVLLATPHCPTLGPAHGTAALDDLRNGCDLAIGPLFGGGWYLIGLARPIAALADLPADSWHNPDVMALAIAAAHGAGLEIGLLRPERRLATPADMRAARVDPLVPDEVRAVLNSWGAGT